MFYLSFSFIDYLQDKFGIGTPSFTNIVAIIAVIVLALWVFGMGYRIICAAGAFLLAILIPTCTMSALKQCQDSRAEKILIEDSFRNPYE